MTSPWSVPIFISLTIPSTAGPGEARTVITSQLPPPLDTYIVPQFGVKYRSGIIYYGNGDDTSYIYDCVVDTPSVITVARHVGVVLHGVVQEHAVGGLQRPLVQAWNSGAGTISHIFDSDIFEILTNDDPVFRQFIMGSGGGISFNAGGDTAPFVVQNEGPVSIRNTAAAGGVLNLNSNGGVTHITGRDGIDLVSSFGDIDLLATNFDINITSDDVISLTTSDINISADDAVNINTPAIVLNGVNIGQGMKAYISDDVNSGLITVEAVIMTTPAMTFVDGRAYAISWRGSVFPSVANTFHFVRIRKTNLAGAILHSLSEYSTPGVGGQQNFYDSVIIRRQAGAGNLAGVAIALTGQHSTGNGTWNASATNVRYLKVEDIGLANDYPKAPFIT